MFGLLSLFAELTALVALAAVLLFRGFAPVGLFSPVHLCATVLTAELMAERDPS
jgi:hypothetical protein